jgi:predicted DNA-binding transcriptional regulator YafY
MAAINEAIGRGRCLDLVYRGRQRKEPTRRRVSPHKLWFAGDALYLVGYCHLRRDVRLFAVDRIESLAVADAPSSIPSDADMDGPMTAGLGAFSGRPELVKIRFSPPAADYIADKVWHPSQRITRRSDGLLVFEATVAVNAELVGFVLRWGPAAEALSPPDLRHRVHEALRTALDVYGSR